MSSLYLRLELLSDVVATARSATVGGHQSLSYIPGAQLLGAVAGKLYAELEQRDPELAFQVFHSGRVRFGCALPGLDGGPAMPVPLAWHHPKGADWVAGDRVAPIVRNLSRVSRDTLSEWAGRQPKQVRRCFVDDDCRVVDPRVSYSMRTAIGAEGRARDGFLFGIEALQRNNVCFARVDADEARLLDLVRPVLVGDPGQEDVGRVFYLGRSRAAEFGKVRISSCDASWQHKTQPPRPREALLLCLSDLCLMDEVGLPTLEPRPEYFGLPSSWSLDTARTFLRTRSYSPFNGKRRKPDLERQVIVAGSVLFFTANDAADGLDSKKVQQTLQSGVGACRQDGLGQLLWEPAILADAAPASTTVARADDTAAGSASASAVRPELPADDLGLWLEPTIAMRDAEELAWELAQRWQTELSRWRIPNSQWGEVRRFARRQRGVIGGAAALRRELGDFTSKGVRALEGAWGSKRRGPGGVDLTAADALLACIDGALAKHGEKSLTIASAVELLGVRAVGAARQADRRPS